MMLAETTSPSTASLLWQILEICAVLSGIASPIIMILMMKSDKKQKREISFEVEPVSKVEFKEHVSSNTKRHGELFHGIDVAKKQCAEQLAVEVRLLNEKVDENYRDITEKLRTLPNEIVTMFRNTKGLM